MRVTSFPPSPTRPPLDRSILPTRREAPRCEGRRSPVEQTPSSLSLSLVWSGTGNKRTPMDWETANTERGGVRFSSTAPVTWHHREAGRTLKSHSEDHINKRGVIGTRGTDHSSYINLIAGLVTYALRNGQPVNSVLNGVLPLHAAASSGNEAIVKLLIEYGADVNSPRLPRRYSNDQSRGSGLAVGTSGSTPLHFAAANGHTTIISILLSYGAQVSSTEKNGLTPEAIAIQKGYNEAAELLHSWALSQDGSAASTTSSSAGGKHHHGHHHQIHPQRSFDTLALKLSNHPANPQNLLHHFPGSSSHQNLGSGSSSSLSLTPGGAAGPIRRASANLVHHHIHNRDPSHRRPSLPSVFEKAAHPATTLKLALGLSKSSQGSGGLKSSSSRTSLGSFTEDFNEGYLLEEEDGEGAESERDGGEESGTDSSSQVARAPFGGVFGSSTITNNTTARRPSRASSIGSFTSRLGFGGGSAASSATTQPATAPPTKTTFHPEQLPAPAASALARANSLGSSVGSTSASGAPAATNFYRPRQSSGLSGRSSNAGSVGAAAPVSPRVFVDDDEDEEGENGSVTGRRSGGGGGPPTSPLAKSAVLSQHQRHGSGASSTGTGGALSSLPSSSRATSRERQPSDEGTTGGDSESGSLSAPRYHHSQSQNGSRHHHHRHTHNATGRHQHHSTQHHHLPNRTSRPLAFRERTDSGDSTSSSFSMRRMGSGGAAAAGTSSAASSFAGPKHGVLHRTHSGDALPPSPSSPFNPNHPHNQQPPQPTTTNTNAHGTGTRSSRSNSAGTDAGFSSPSPASSYSHPGTLSTYAPSTHSTVATSVATSSPPSAQQVVARQPLLSPLYEHSGKLDTSSLGLNGNLQRLPVNGNGERLTSLALSSKLEQAHKNTKKVEQELLSFGTSSTVTGTAGSDSSSSNRPSLSQQLAAYGQSLNLERKLKALENGNLNGNGAAPSSERYVWETIGKDGSRVSTPVTSGERKSSPDSDAATKSTTATSNLSEDTTASPSKAAVPQWRAIPSQDRLMPPPSSGRRSVSPINSSNNPSGPMTPVSKRSRDTLMDRGSHPTPNSGPATASNLSLVPTRASSPSSVSGSSAPHAAGIQYVEVVPSSASKPRPTTATTTTTTTHKGNRSDKTHSQKGGSVTSSKDQVLLDAAEQARIAAAIPKAEITVVQSKKPASKGGFAKRLLSSVKGH